MAVGSGIAPSGEQIAEFCRSWQIRRLSLFGSVARGDLGPESDVDVLVSFEPGAEVTLWDWGPMVEELEAICGRRVDLVEEEAITNPIRKRAILADCEILYAS